MANGLWAVLLLSCFLSSCTAVDYTVGNSNGWTTGLDYSTWASKKRFFIGDTLTFKYPARDHNVVQVNSGDYDSCSTANAISTDSSGSTVVTLKAPGTQYFISGVHEHCAGGMKLAVNVGGTTARAPSSPVTPNRTVTPTPNDTITTTPVTTAAPSSSGSLVPTAVAVLTGLALIQCTVL